MGAVRVRPLEDADEERLRSLRERSADGGRIAFRPVHRAEPAEARAARRPGATGFVAETSEGVLVGEAWVTPWRVAAGRDTPLLAWLHGLSVDPGRRRQGVARLLTGARLAHADTLPGPVVVAAAIQAGNTASAASARHWCDRSLGTVRVTPVPPPRRDPTTTVLVRQVDPADAAELDVVAAAIADTARGLALAPAPDAEELGRWLGVEVGGSPLHEYLVAVAPDGRLLAGLGLQDEGRLQGLQVVAMPAAIRLANRFLRVVPPDGVMANGNVRIPFVRPGQDDAARALWQAARWRWRRRTTSLVTALDRRGPLASVLGSPRWLPSTTLDVVVRDHPDVDLGRGPLAPWV